MAGTGCYTPSAADEAPAFPATMCGLERFTIVLNDGSSAVVTNDRRPKLSDVGVSKDFSSRAQRARRAVCHAETLCPSRSHRSPALAGW